MTASRMLVAGVAVACVGCATHQFGAPSGPAVSEPAANEIWQAASTTCRDTTNVHASLGLSGRIRELRVPGMAGAMLYAIVSSAGDIGLEARVSGQLIFRLGGRAERATLLLAGDHRVVVAPASDIVGALIGVPMGPEQLLGALAGCISRSATAEHGDRYGDLLAVTTSDATVYLERHGAAWVPRAGVIADVAMDYRLDSHRAIRDIEFRSGPNVVPAIALSLHVRALERNVSLDPSMFAVAIPDDARPMTTDELRRTGVGGA